MKTQVFENHQAFLAREDKRINGVLPGYHVPENDDGNIGCWMCFNCTYCTDCTYCTGCTDCKGCTYCADCTDCTGCTDCKGCTDCADCTDCTGCTDCKGCTDCADCTDCARCRAIPAGAVYACMTGLYRYTCSPRIHEDGTQWVQMGCYLRTREEWERDEWNNPKEFPNDGSRESQRRRFALMAAFAWLDANAKKEDAK